MALVYLSVLIIIESIGANVNNSNCDNDNFTITLKFEFIHVIVSLHTECVALLQRRR